ncbi:MAG: class I SAM-dependent methyltransferase [Anaerolineales bacterium]
MFSQSANYYDELYNALGKDYPKEVKKTEAFIKKHIKSKGKALLDVGCGTGHHAGLLSKHYQVDGLDLDKNILAIARKKHPLIPFYQGNMIDFKLNKQYDIIISLFSSIGYVQNKPNLNKTIKNLANHLNSGGVMLIEPWFSPDEWNPGRVFTLHVNQPELKITRMSYSSQKGALSILDFHYLIGTKKGVEHRVETHKLGLFYKKDYLFAFQKAGLNVIHDSKGLDGRGLYIGMKP